MVALLLDEKLLAIERALVEAGIPHAFGGANALAYYATPRATADIDLNIFLPATRAALVLGVLGALGVSVGEERIAKAIAKEEQVRLFWDNTPIDLFFLYDDLHTSSMERRRVVEFGDEKIHVLSAEDLITYKVIFDREKDWRDIAEVVFASNDPLDIDYVRGWLRRIFPDDDPRLARLDRVVESEGRDLG